MIYAATTAAIVSAVIWAVRDATREARALRRRGLNYPTHYTRHTAVKGG